MTKGYLGLLLVAVVSACGTYYDPADEYARGLRYFDRKEFELARRAWEPLAKSGDCDAEYRLGTLYFLGAGVPRDYATAQQWLRAAANRGQAFAQVLLSVMYAHEVIPIRTVNMTAWFNCQAGCGYEKDMAVAYQWARLAERNTPYEEARATARKMADILGGELSADQRATADRFVQDWKPVPEACRQRRL